ncbi:MAG: T9SS type A sorting domain-containing protein [Chitinophagaceae bacterium]|nr:T9SS type A sorting domain-containing protein [Chitinophagaceae bacterium]
MRSYTGLAGFILACLTIYCNIARAQGLYPISTDQKIVKSSLIIEGKVISKKSAWNAKHTMIYTTNEVEVYKVFKGSVQKNTVEIITVGGAVDGYAIQASHMLELSKNDIGVFFCRPHTAKSAPPAFNTALEVYSSSQGFLKYNLSTKTATAPFIEYTDIEGLLYKDLRAKLGRSPEIKNTKFSIERAKSKFQSDNSTLAPLISNFSPSTVTAGALQDPDNNVLTINGSGFGSGAGDAAVLFQHADLGAGNKYPVEFSSPFIISWSSTQIRVRVPTQAGTGPITVVDNAGNTVNSSTSLNVLYSVLTADFGGAIGIKQFNLGNMNGSGGYSVKFSTSTANSGLNINSSPAKATFLRAMNTWKESIGLNFIEGGTTSQQSVNPDDGENIVEYDNDGTGLGPLSDGVLATCYSGVTICTNDPANAARKTGFDIVIRNTGYSSGSTPFTLGPCPPLSENSNVVDLETVLLHELGHALNLGHIVDPLVGAGAGTASPGKVMHFSIAYNQRRISLDYAAKTGGLYQVTPHGYNFGNCVVGDPAMAPIEPVVEAKDDCPATFPISTIPTATVVNFDLAHATSNKFSDPAFNQWKTDGTGSNVTNTAFYAFKTNQTGGNLTLEVMNYITTPAAIADCPLGSTGVPPKGVKISLYKVNSCPTGGSFPTPINYQLFNSDGELPVINGLAASSTYLVAVDGIQNTKAIFDLKFTGTALPVQSTELTGLVVGAYNELRWVTDPTFDVFSMVLERSEDGVSFQEIKEILDQQQQQMGQYSDLNPLPGLNYYRLRVENSSGLIQYSDVVTLNRSENEFVMKISPNPAISVINIEILNNDFGPYGATIYNALGQQVLVRKFNVSTRRHVETLRVRNLLRGMYFVVVFGKNGEKVKSATVKLK